MSDFLIMPEEIDFGWIQFTRHVAPSEHPYYEYTTCEWQGDSRYCLVQYEFFEGLAETDYEMIDYPIGGIVEGVVFFVGQYHLQLLGYDELRAAYVCERLNETKGL